MEMGIGMSATSVETHTSASTAEISTPSRSTVVFVEWPGTEEVSAEGGAERAWICSASSFELFESPICSKLSGFCVWAGILKTRDTLVRY